MEGHFTTGQSPQLAVVPMEEEEEEEEYFYHKCQLQWPFYKEAFTHFMYINIHTQQTQSMYCVLLVYLHL